MIRISRITDYGIVLMAYLAERDGDTPHNAREVSESTQLPLPVVSKILKSLAREGLLVSHRGAKGGYSLARDSHEIPVTEMIGALEGPFGLTECATRPGPCPQESDCQMREPWQRINRVVYDALANITLADLVGPLPESIVSLVGLAGGPSDLDASKRT
jgi:FeS assembly SUF system regulator